jgi:lipoyl(octanoyl) transferase
MSQVYHTHWLGTIEYGAALRLQKELTAMRALNDIPNTLLLVEHPPTYTLGIDGHREHLLISPEEMARLNIAFHRVDRGGMVTYHGPGQLVCYPILNLKEYGYGYHRYLKMLESVIIRALSTVGVRAFRERGQAGVSVFARGHSPALTPWPQQVDTYIAQIAAIGVKINENAITSHGFAINVNPNLEYFKHIIPCGMQGCQVTSLQQVIGRPITVTEVLEPVIQAFSEIFKLESAALNTTDLASILGLEQALA